MKIQTFPSWNLQKNQSSHMTRLLPLLQFARKNWISTSASINAQLRYSFGTTLFYVNLPRLRMVLVKLEDVSLGPEPCTLLFLNLLRDEPVLWQAWTHWTWDQPLESFVASSGSIKSLMSCKCLLHLARFLKKICFKLQMKLLCLRIKAS